MKQGELPEPTVGTSLLSIVLAVGGGYGDAGGYILAKSFTGHVTGNTVLAAIGLALGNRNAILVRLLAVVCFLGATAAGIALASSDNKPSHALSFALLVESLMVLAAPLGLLRHSNHADLQLILALCLAMGLQNGVYRKVAGIGLHTNYITGDATTLLATLVQRTREDGEPYKKVKTIGSIWIGFAFGALLAGVFITQHGAAAVWLLELPLWLAAWIAWRMPQRKTNP